jgi:GH43 family beta-xylosidase
MRIALTSTMIAGVAAFSMTAAYLMAVSVSPLSAESIEVRMLKNPIASSGADPWVIFRDGAYYYCYSRSDMVAVKKAERLQDIDRGRHKFVWNPPTGEAYSRELWAPELHYLDGKWYIYVAADDGRNETHRMYVLEGTTQDPQDLFVLKGKIADSTDRWAIDGTVLRTEAGELFFIWSGWEDEVNVAQNLYIAPMSNPWTISGDRVLISEPEYEWETVGRPAVNEGPEVLQRGGRTFVVYSASGSWTDSYCLGQLELVGPNPLNRSSWVKKAKPVFTSGDSVFGPGHASFTVSPDGAEDWIVYHAAKYRGSGWNREVRAQRFGWTAEGEPDFRRPVDAGIEVPAPSED